MPLQLLSSFGSRGVESDLLTMNVDIEDTSYLSTYFDIVEFTPVFTAGKNSFSFNGTPLLLKNSEIHVQCLDSNGNSLYLEGPISKTQFKDIANFLVSIHVYNETYNGIGKLILVGTTARKEIVRWVANISIDKTLRNTSKTRFYNTPTIETRPLLYPVISNDIAQNLTKIVDFSGNFYASAITPPKDTIQTYINPKKDYIDYRLVCNSLSPDGNIPQVYPTSSMNTQMEGQIINIFTKNIQSPYSYASSDVNISASYKIKKVLNNTTIQLSEAFLYPYKKDLIVTNINLGTFTASYKWVAYNTSSDVYKKYSPVQGPVVYAKESYVEVVYRNINVFTGFVARHKLYRKSQLYPGDYQLVADEPIGTRELLVDPVTANKTYNLIGEFYNSFHIAKYWFTSSSDLYLSHSITPRINAMKIGATSFDKCDGNKYVIVKTDSIDPLGNTATYYPYDEEEFNNLQGLKYNSNFIDLKAGSLYALSMNVQIEKDKYTSAKVEFFFTSSIPTIKNEKTYNSIYGMKLGEIVISDNINYKVIDDKQYLFFTPANDYYGSLIIVPHLCSITLSEVSLGVYGDYGFSPYSLSTKIPFPINVANEGWQLKAELYDVNSNLIYSDLKTIQTFDENGKSLYTIIDINNTNIPTLNATYTTYISGSLTISRSLYTPNLPGCPPSYKRFVAWEPPVNYPPANDDGAFCYTTLIGVDLIPTNNTIESNDYINVITTSGNEKSIAVRYSGSMSEGKRIFINSAGTKYTYS